MSGIDNNTVLMLHFEDFTDSSLSPKTVNPVGNVAIVTGGLFGNCADFDGAGDAIEIPDSDDFAFGSGNFCVDFRVTLDTIDSVMFYQQNDGVNSIFMQYYKDASNSILSIQVYTGAVNTTNRSVTYMPAIGETDHITFEKTGSTYSIVVDGDVIHSGAGGAVPNIAAPVRIGSRADGARCLNGRLEEFRVSKVSRWNGLDFTPPSAAYTEVEPPAPPAVGVSEQAHWSDKAAILDPNAYVYRCGVFNVTETEPVYLLNGWQMNYNSNNNFWYHRKGDVDNALMLPAGTPIKHSGSPPGYGFDYGYAYYAKPSLVNGDARYDDARDLYYQRMERLKTLPLYSAEVSIAQGTVRGGSHPGISVMLPNDFENGLIVHQSMMDGCWMVLQDPSKTPAVDQTILNLWDEIDDVKNQRTSGKVFLPFKRSVFPQLFIGFGSAFISASSTPTNPITPVNPGSATYPQYGQIKYYKLPPGW